jgi:hypothetical protein
MRISAFSLAALVALRMRIGDSAEVVTAKAELHRWQPVNLGVRGPTSAWS